MTAVTISAVKSYVVADDGATATVTIEAKNVGELALVIPAGCFDDFVSALNRAKSLGQIQDPKIQEAKKAGQVAVKMPKNWLVTSDLQVHGVVLLVLEHQTPMEAGYALPADTAKKMAAALVKNADAVLANKTAKKD